MTTARNHPVLAAAATLSVRARRRSVEAAHEEEAAVA